MATRFQDTACKNLRDADALLESVVKGELTRVETLLRAGANLDAATDTGTTVLMRAVVNNQVAIAKLLLEYGADINARRRDGFSALLFAVFFGHVELVRLLLQKGANLDVQSKCATTAEMWARARGFSEVVCMLKEARAERCATFPPPLNPQSLACRSIKRLADNPDIPDIDVETRLASEEISPTEIAKSEFAPSRQDCGNAGMQDEKANNGSESTRTVVRDWRRVILETAESLYGPHFFRWLTSPRMRMAGLTIATVLIAGLASYVMWKTTLETSGRARATIKKAASPGGRNPAVVYGGAVTTARQQTQFPSLPSSPQVPSPVVPVGIATKTRPSREMAWRNFDYVYGESDRKNAEKVSNTAQGARVSHSASESAAASSASGIPAKSSRSSADNRVVTIIEAHTDQQPAPLRVGPNHGREDASSSADKNERELEPALFTPGARTQPKGKVIQWP